MGKNVNEHDTDRHEDQCVFCRIIAGEIPSEQVHADEKVIAFGTWEAREFLRAGTLAEGDSADLVIYPADPRGDIGVLARPDAVVLRGQIV